MSNRELGSIKPAIASATVAAAISLLATPSYAGMGDLDPAFGTNGRATVAGNAGPALVERPDGRIVVLGSASQPSDPAAIAMNQLLASGQPDPSFGINGSAQPVLAGQSVDPRLAILQPDGAAVIAGYRWLPYPQAFVARIHHDGTADGAFGDFGHYMNTTELTYSSLAMQPDGTVFAAYTDWGNDFVNRFSASGQELSSIYLGIIPDRISLQSDGWLVVSGRDRTANAVVVIRTDGDGHRDPAFGDGGAAQLIDGYSSEVTVEPGTDKVVLCGPQGVVRLTANGQPDASFGATGTGYATFGADGLPAAYVDCIAVATLQDGGIVYVAGRHSESTEGQDQLFVGGLTASGSVDSRFGNGSGSTAIDLGPIVLDQYRRHYGATSGFTTTRDGNALIAWRGEPAIVARIDLNGEALLPPVPTTQPPTDPTSTPTPTPTPSGSGNDGTGGNGGGGGMDGAGLLLLAAPALLAAMRRRIGPDRRR